MQEKLAELLIIGVASPYTWEIVESAKRQNIAVSCVDNYGGADQNLPNLSRLKSSTSRLTPFTVGLSSAIDRSVVYSNLAEDGFSKVTSLIDPTAIIASSTIVGHGVYVNAGAVIGSHVKVGCAANINRSASIGHHSTIGWGASIGPGVTTGGYVSVGQNTLIGVGAVLLPGVSIGEYSTIGAGAVVTKDVSEGATVVGNPGREIVSKKMNYQTLRIEKCPFC